jgi:hypothetical protein
MLAETFDATLARSFDEGGDRPLVGAVIEVDMDVLRGSMVVHDIAPPDPDEIEFTLSLWFYEDGVVGSLGGIVTYERGNSVMAGPFSIATWPRAFGSSE